MRLKTSRAMSFAVVLLTVLAVGCSSQDSSAPHFAAEISGPEQEAAYVCGLIEHFDYFRDRGYTPELPDHPAVDAILREQFQGSFEEEDCASLSHVFEELYDRSGYTRAHRKVVRILPRAEQAYGVFLEYKKQWGFRVADQYMVLLTLYGPGGMFDPQEGIIWLMITDAGSFKMNDDPTYTIVHEATHIGIDEPIVRRFGLSQAVSERIVDRFIVDHFGEILPEYQMQEMGDPAIDPYLNHRDSWERLPEYIGQYVEESALVQPGMPDSVLVSAEMVIDSP